MREDERPDFTDDDMEMEATRAPLLDHLIELRSRLIWSIAALAVATILCFFLARPLYNILLEPLVRVAEVERGETRFELIYTAPLEVFFVELKLSLFAGVFLAFPIMGWQIYSFVAPGLYRREKGTVLPFLVAAPVLFTLGALFVYFVMLPLIWGLNQFGWHAAAQAWRSGLHTFFSLPTHGVHPPVVLSHFHHGSSSVQNCMGSCTSQHAGGTLCAPKMDEVCAASCAASASNCVGLSSSSCSSNW